MRTWVFAYGSNMHLEDLARWLRDGGRDVALPRAVVPARLADHALAWHYRSRARGGGAADVVPRPGQEVRGIALDVDAALLAALDEKEGHPRRYDRGEAPLEVRALADGRRLDAWCYRVTPAHRRDVVVPPTRAYLRLLIEAAETQGLGADWVARLARVATRG